MKIKIQNTKALISEDEYTKESIKMDPRSLTPTKEPCHKSYEIAFCVLDEFLHLFLLIFLFIF